MRYDIIKTDNYLLILSDEEIKEGEACKDGYGNILPFADLSEYGLGYDRNTIKKIIAHLPLNGASVIEGVDLLPSLEDEVVKLAAEWNTKGVFTSAYAFTVGYNKAKDKYKYTEEDIRNAIVKGFFMCMDREHDITEVVEQIMQSLQQPKMPIGFEREIEVGCIDNGKEINQYKVSYNSQGLIQWVGKYIY